MKKLILLPLVILALSACAATTTLDTVQSDVRLQINDQPDVPLAADNKTSYPTTSFGQYKFKAEKEGMDPMYGIMPLKFNAGYLVADILFFAPATFFNLREVFPYYQFDIEKNEVRYKLKETDEWTIYSPTPEEAQHAKSYFTS